MASPPWDSAWVVTAAAAETPEMFCAISVDPPAASWTDRDISFVVAVCSSTAEAMVSATAPSRSVGRQHRELHVQAGQPRFDAGLELVEVRGVRRRRGRSPRVVE